jgi:hypothetical protein
LVIVPHYSLRLKKRLNRSISLYIVNYLPERVDMLFDAPETKAQSMIDFLLNLDEDAAGTGRISGRFRYFSELN